MVTTKTDPEDRPQGDRRTARPAGLEQAALDALLAIFDADRAQAGERYVELRRKLVKFFAWRRVQTPEEYADETLDRVGRRLAAGARIEAADPALYVYGVARNVLREHWTAEKAAGTKPALAMPLPAPAQPAEPALQVERRAACLEVCLSGLDAVSRDVILRYYENQRRAKLESRRQLARALSVSPETLRVRLHRIRAKLLLCVSRCLSREDETDSIGDLHRVER